MARHRGEKKREPADCRVLVVELLQDGGSKLVAVDRFRQIVLKPWRAHTSLTPRATRAMAGPTRPWRTCMWRSRSRNSSGSGLGRVEVAHNDIGDERGSNRVVGTGGGDECAREFEHRPKGVARELVVIDHQDVNSSGFRC